MLGSPIPEVPPNTTTRSTGISIRLTHLQANTHEHHADQDPANADISVANPALMRRTAYEDTVPSIQTGPSQRECQFVPQIISAIEIKRLLLGEGDQLRNGSARPN